MPIKISAWASEPGPQTATSAAVGVRHMSDDSYHGYSERRQNHGQRRPRIVAGHYELTSKAT
jgi:hypothetical protein